MPSPQQHKERVLAHQETQSMRRALQITSALLAMLAQHANVSKSKSITIRHEGKVIAEISIDEALDLANEALEPEALAHSPTPESEQHNERRAES